jgi:hypothetical protein
VGEGGEGEWRCVTHLPALKRDNHVLSSANEMLFDLNALRW